MASIEEMLRALMQDRGRFGTVNYSPGMADVAKKALLGEQNEIEKRNLARRASPQGPKTPLQAVEDLFKKGIGAYERSLEGDDREALLDILRSTPMVEALVGPRDTSQTPDLESEYKKVPLDPIDPESSQLAGHIATEYPDDALTLDGDAVLSADGGGSPPPIVNALVGPIKSALADVTAVNEPVSEAQRIMAALEGFKPKTPAGRNLREQFIATQYQEQALQERADTERAYAAQLLEEEREFVLLTARNLAESETAKARGRGSGETFGKNPVWLKDEDGNDVLAVVGDQGTLKILDIPVHLTPNRVTTGEQEISRAKSERVNARINKGVAASLAIPVLNRSLELLDTLETGGYDKVKYEIQSVFGVEGANEAELSNALGKSVLSQLKSIFGAAFSEAEASKLENMEAGFGKSTAGNIAIIKNALTLAESHYRRGLSDAFAIGDEPTHTAMQDNYSIKYEGGGSDPANLEAGAADEEPITEADIEQTMRDMGMSREEVIERLRAQGRI
jgi:hypothetical protein